MTTTGDLEAGLRDLYRHREEGGCSQGAAHLADYASGGLAPEERLAFEAHTRGCADCQELLRTFDGAEAEWQRKEIVAARPGLLARLLGFIEAPQRRIGGMLAGAGALACVAVLVVVTMRGRQIPTEGLREMGGWQLHLAVDREGTRLRVAEGEALRTGDRIGFFYSAEQAGELALFWVDAQGEIALVFPAGKGDSAPVLAGREIALPDGAVLTAGQECEWAVAVYAPRPFEVAWARGAVQRMFAERRGCRLGVADLPGAQTQVVGIRR